MPAAPLGLIAALLLRAEPSAASGLAVETELKPPPEPVRFSLGLRTELRSGHPGTAGSATTDLELDPVAATRVPFANGGLTLAYEPRLFIIVSAAPQHVSYLHRARLIVDGEATPRWQLSLTVRGSYGEYDFLPLSTVLPGTTSSGSTGQAGSSGPPPSAPSPSTPIPSVSSIPNQRFVRVVDLNATAGINHLFSPRLSWLLSGGYQLSGGVDANAQNSVPLQQGPLLSTGPRWTLGPNDSLGVLLSGSDSHFSSGPRAAIVNLTTTWSHAWSRTWQTDLTGGAGAFHGTVPHQPVNNSVLPVGGSLVTHTWLRPVGNVVNTLQFLAAPLPDALNGVVYERLSAALISSVPLTHQLWFDLTGGASMSLSSPQRDARGEAKLTFTVVQQLAISAGGRVAWLQGSELLGQSGFGWLGLVTVSAYALGTPL
jgi:hypothetical protein